VIGVEAAGDGEQESLLLEGLWVKDEGDRNCCSSHGLGKFIYYYKIMVM
jgi:hypothetical protein